MLTTLMTLTTLITHASKTSEYNSIKIEAEVVNIGTKDAIHNEIRYDQFDRTAANARSIPAATTQAERIGG